MCGIAGELLFAAESAGASDAAAVRAMCDRMAARGPDASGFWTSDDRRVTLGHRRLSILDLDVRANQPMVSASGRYVAVFNGEIYNFREIRMDLERRGIVFRTASDTEVVLALFESIPDKDLVFRRLRGMFAIAIWDTHAGTLTLARDPYGIKPLYMARAGGRWLFASQVKAIASTGLISCERNPRAEAAFRMLGSVPEPHTWFRDIQALPSGTWTQIRADGSVAESRRYWDIGASWSRSERHPASSADGIAEAVRELLFESVRHHLVSDVPVGVFLSGGIDSGALAGMMSEIGVPGLQGITIAYDEFSGSSQDEAPVAARIAGCYGIRHVIRRVSQREFLDDLPRILDSMDQPSIDGVNTWYASKAAAELGLKVVVSGVGGDELFLGYESFRQLPRLVQATRYLGRIPGARMLAQGLAQVRAAQTGNPRWKHVLSWCRTVTGAWWLRRSVCSPDELAEAMGTARSGQALQDFSPDGWVLEMVGSRPQSPELELAQIESMTYLRNQLLRDSDWASMAHGVELRTPLVDAHLLQAVEPFLSRFREFPSKALLAHAPSRPLPRDVLERRKTGFGIPVKQWLDRPQGVSSPGRHAWMNQVLDAYEAVGSAK